MTHDSHGRRRLGLLAAAALLPLAILPYLLVRWYLRRGASDEERRAALAGDGVVARPRTGYTLGITIRAAPREVWPWLAQMGQGRGGFYTHEWVENLLGARIHNAGRIVPALQRIGVGDTIRLTPDPYLGRPGQLLTVAEVRPERALVLAQTLPNGEPGSWAFVLRPVRGPGGAEATRLLFRRRGGRPTPFDRVAMPGYVFMDRGMLRGIRERAESVETA